MNDAFPEWHTACTGEGSVNPSADRMVVNSNVGGAWQLGAFRVLAECRGASPEACGDFYALRLREPKRLAVVIGDACGRGSEGAKLLPYILPPLGDLSDSMTQPRLLLEALNRKVAGLLDNDRFVTGAVMELDAQLGILTVANAGHVPVLLRSASGEVVLVGRASGPPLGILPDCSYEQESHPFNEGDVLVFMSDGVLEAVETDLTAMTRFAALIAPIPGNVRDVHRRLVSKLNGLSVARRADDMTLISLGLADDAASEPPAAS